MKYRQSLKQAVCVLVTMMSLSFIGKAQDLPAPNLERIITDIKANNLKGTLVELGIPADQVNLVKIERPNENDKKNISGEPNLYFENARTFRDRCNIIVMAVLPKSAFGVTYRIPLHVVYQRFEPDGDGWKILNNWKLHTYYSDIKAMVNPEDLAIPTNEAKKSQMENYLATHNLPEEYKPFGRRVLKVGTTGVYNKNQEFGIEDSYELGKYYWRLVVPVETIDEETEKGITQTETNLAEFTFRVGFKNGKFDIIDLKEINLGMSESEAQAATVPYEINEIPYETPFIAGNLYDNGWSEVVGKFAPMKRIPCTKNDLYLLAKAVENELKKLNYTTEGEWKNIQLPLADGVSLEAVYLENKVVTERYKLDGQITEFLGVVHRNTDLSYDFADANPNYEQTKFASGNTDYFLDYATEYNVVVSKKVKNKSEDTYNIRYKFKWSCINGHMLITEITR